MKRTSLISLLAFTLVIPVSLIAATKSDDTPSRADLLAKYVDAGTGDEEVRILIMPGHEPGFGGTAYQGVYEREIVVEVADQLEDYLGQNPRFDVIVARTNSSWNKDLEEYFEEEWKKIERFVKTKKRTIERLVRRGDFEERGEGEQVDHASAPSDVALRLYGINKWANENDIDLVLHLHINDAPDHGPDAPSAHAGFAIYVPDKEYGNAKTSRPIAEAIAGSLAGMSATSTLPIENQGVVEDQELIAIGSYDTLSVPSVLIEYGYITEPKFTQPEVRQVVTKDLAYQTYLGIQNFFNEPVAAKHPTTALPYTFTEASALGSSSPATYALQAGLHTLGMYPVATSTPLGTTTPSFAQCSISGLMTPCTVDAIVAFQKSRNIPATGTLTPATLNALNTLFSDKQVAPIAMPPPVPSTTVPVTTGTCTAFTHTLEVGADDASTAGEVTRLQTILAKDKGVYPEGLVTGYYGPATQKALERFQVKQNLTKPGNGGYGLVGPATRAALQAACS